jgi:hypothetical protein
VLKPERRRLSLGEGSRLRNRGGRFGGGRFRGDLGRRRRGWLSRPPGLTVFRLGPSRPTVSRLALSRLALSRLALSRLALSRLALSRLALSRLALSRPALR